MSSDNVLKSINPWNGKLLHEYEVDSDDQVLQKLEAAQSAFKEWRQVPVEERAIRMLEVKEVLKKNSDKYARLMTEEMGKPITQSIVEINKCAWVCEYYAKYGPKFLQQQNTLTDADVSYVRFDALGPVLAVMPWNYPFWQVFRFAIPGLVAGNVGLLKHASSVQGCAAAIEELFAEAKFPRHVFQTLFIPSSRVEAVINNPIVKAVTLTGSGKAGESVASIAGRNIKKTVLELGGNNACIICKDADLDKYLDTIAWSRFQNTGQSCIAGKRFFIHEAVYDEFMERLVKKVEAYKIGDPMKEETEVGPMSSTEQAETLYKQMQESIDKGAELVLGGEQNDALFQPTILTADNTEMPAFRDELFGPVAACMKVKSLNEAIKLNNDSIYGLGVSIYMGNTTYLEKTIARIEDGAVFVNELVKSDPRLPFGGTKRSGYGRELSDYGIREFVNKKTVYINL